MPSKICCKTIQLTLLLAITIAFFFYLSAPAYADNAASNSILIYNQNSANAAGGSNDGQQSCRSLALRGTDTMGGAGCGIYAMAHACQWLTGEKRTISNAAELLQVFINSNISAGSNAPWEGSLDEKYGPVLNNCFGIKSTTWPKNESGWLELNNNGGAAILNVPYIPGYINPTTGEEYSGHYNCAVEAIMADIDGNGSTELWIHIVDSSAASTFHRLYRKGQYPAYTINSHSMISTSTGNGYWRGDEYWISYSVLKNAGITVAGAYLPNGNYKTIQLWGIDNNSVWNGTIKVWGKREDDDPNHYAVFYIDNEAVTGYLSSDQSGFFSCSINTLNYSNGSHTLRIYYANSDAGWTDSRTIVFDNRIRLWGIDDNSEWSGSASFWAKRFDDDTNHYCIFYLDDNAISGYLSSDSSNYFSLSVDTTRYENGNHKLSVYYANSEAGWWDHRTIVFYNNIETPPAM